MSPQHFYVYHMPIFQAGNTLSGHAETIEEMLKIIASRVSKRGLKDRSGCSRNYPSTAGLLRA